MEKSIGSNLRQEVISYSKRKSVQLSSKTSNGVWTCDGGGHKETSTRDEGCRDENVEIGMGVTRKDKIRNKHIRDTVKIEQLRMKMKEGRLRWYEYVIRKDQKYEERRVMKTELPVIKKRGRPKRRFLDVVKENTGKVGAREKDIENTTVWKKMIRCGYP